MIFNSHTVVDIEFPPLQICSYRPPGCPPRWFYMAMLFLLQLTQLSSQLSLKISTIKNEPDINANLTVTPHLTLKMTAAEAVETSVTTINSLSQDLTNLDDQPSQTLNTSACKLRPRWL